MPKYEIKGKGKNTGRRRRRIYKAPNEAEAKKLAEADATMVDEISELPPDPPTERQIEFAMELGLSIPDHATKEILSDLISIKLDRDKPATERHKHFGRLYNVEFTEYIGKKALFNQIQAELVVPGRERELLEWFTFRVYRELDSGSDHSPIAAPNDPVIQEIASELVTDERIVKSVRRYEGDELIWFGQWTSPNGYMYEGGSNRTLAFKQASQLLRERARFSKKPKTHTPPSGQQKSQVDAPSNQATGCVFIIFVAIAKPEVMLTLTWIGELIS